MARSERPALLYDINHGAVEEKKRTTTEYQRSVEVSKARDTFPCGHVLCHHCIRKYVKPYRLSALCCPVCDKEVEQIYVNDTATAVNYGTDDVANITLMTNYEDVVKRFNGINLQLRSLKEESVQTRSIGMTYTNCDCHMCDENHGSLKVIQEYNELAVTHQRPLLMDRYFYRLASGHIVTTFFSKVNSSCVCVPCTYKDLRESSHYFPELQLITDAEAQKKPQTALAEVGKLIAKNTAPISCLQGKNVIEIDHTIRVRERGDKFDFFDTADQIKSLVQKQERSLIRMATKQIQDTGQLYHIQESNSIELDMNETTV